MSLSHIRQRVINGYQHIMACPLVQTWVVLVVMHFIVQVALQGVTFRDNKQAKEVTSLCLSLARVPSGLPLMGPNDLSMCDGIPGRYNATCVLIASASGPLPPSVDDVDSSAFAGFDMDGAHSVELSGSEYFITGRCAMSLQWIHDIFRDNVAEDIATICFQFWLLIVSLLAVLQDSIPHLAVCLASHLLDVGWAGFRIKSTITLRQRYYKFVVGSACGGEDLLGNWWDRRLNHAAPLFGTNVIILILLGAIAIILFRRFARLGFSRVGASPQITKMYKIALSFSAFLQLAAFFTIMAVGMWIDRVTHGAMSTLAKHILAYQASFIVLAVIIAPWMISGWWGIFREIKWAFILFAVLHAFIFVLWPTMFASAIYRYVLGTWSFFACVSITSYVFVIATTIMAIVCRLHFGRGLEHFLRVEAALSLSGFPGSYFADDAARAHDGSRESLDFDFFDREKGRKGSMESEKEGPMHIRPYTLDSSEYSIHSLAFEMPTKGSKTPPPGATSAAIMRILNKDSVKPLPKVVAKSKSRPVSYVPSTDSHGRKSTIITRDKKNSLIQPPPDAYLQAPYKEIRSRKETPSLMTQATGTSTNSYSHAVISIARMNPIVSAPARTLMMNTMSSKHTPSPGGTGIPCEDRPGVHSVSQRKPTIVKTIKGAHGTPQSAASASWETDGRAGQDVPPRVNLQQQDSYGRI